MSVWGISFFRDPLMTLNDRMYDMKLHVCAGCDRNIRMVLSAPISPSRQTLGRVIQNPIKANPRLKDNRGFQRAC